VALFPLGARGRDGGNAERRGERRELAAVLDREGRLRALGACLVVDLDDRRRKVVRGSRKLRRERRRLEEDVARGGEVVLRDVERATHEQRRGDALGVGPAAEALPVE